MTVKGESEEKNKLGGSTKLAGCSDAAAVWASKSAAEKAAYKEMEITSKKEQSKKRRRREGDAGEPETIKSEQYHSAIKAIKQRNTEAMVQNFGIHTICSLLLIPVISTCFLHLLFGVLVSQILFFFIHSNMYVGYVSGTVFCMI